MGHFTLTSYDNYGRVDRTTFQDGTFVTTAYDNYGRVAIETDQLGQTKSYEYDIYGRLAAVVLPEVINPDTGQPESPRYEYEYDYYGQQTLIRDPLGRETHFTYDQFGRQLTRTLPSINGQPDLTESWEYDGDGRLYKYTDFENQVTEYFYNDLGQVVTKNYCADGSLTPDEVYTYTYDDYGRKETIFEPRGTTEYTYDDRGRVIEIDAPEGLLEYEYDDFDRRTRTFSDNSDILYAYDDFGLLETVTVIEQDNVVLTTPEVTTYTYNVLDLLVETELANGTTTTYTYDDLNRVTEIEHRDALDAVLAGYEYDLADNGLRESVTETRLEADDSFSSVFIDYEYDALDRLIGEAYDSSLTGLDYETEFSYDIVGNRLEKSTTYENDQYESVTYEYNARDQLFADLRKLWEDDSETTLIESESHSYTYDDNGAMLNRVSSGGDSYTYTYNLQGRQATSSVERDENGTDIEVGTVYTYNDGGVRVKAVATTTLDGGTPTVTTTNYLTDSRNPTGYAQVLEERDGSGNAVVSYTIGHDVISQSDGTNVRFLLADAQGSTRLLVDGSEAITDRYNYDAYGNLLSVVYNTTNTPATRLLYNGEQFDPATGQHYLRARYYGPEYARFNRQDPYSGEIADPLTLHKYGYVHANPMNMIDPTGMFGLTGFVAGFSIANSIQNIKIEADLAVYDSVLTTVDGVLAGQTGLEIAQNMVENQMFGALLGFAGGKVFDAVGSLFDDGITIAMPSFGRRGGQADDALVILNNGAYHLRRELNDIAVTGKTAPRLKPVDSARIQQSFKNPLQQRRAQEWTDWARMNGQDLRVNQIQISPDGLQAGINRPDIQFTLRGGQTYVLPNGVPVQIPPGQNRRIYIELDTAASKRGPEHFRRIMSNDPEGLVFLQTVG